MLNTCVCLSFYVLFPNKLVTKISLSFLSPSIIVIDLIPFLIDRSKRAMFKYCCQNPHNVFVTSGSIGWFLILISQLASCNCLMRTYRIQICLSNLVMINITFWLLGVYIWDFFRPKWTHVYVAFISVLRIMINKHNISEMKQLISQKSSLQCVDDYSTASC